MAARKVKSTQAQHSAPGSSLAVAIMCHLYGSLGVGSAVIGKAHNTAAPLHTVAWRRVLGGETTRHRHPAPPTVTATLGEGQ